MGKRKQKKSFLGVILSLVAVVLALVAVLLMFAPAATATAELLGQKASTSYTGANLAFGYTAKQDALITTVEVKIFNASANIVTYILLLVGIIFAILAILGKLGKIAPFAAAVAFLVAGIFFFLSIQFCSPYISDSVTGDLRTEAIKNAKEALSLGAGAIVAGICSIVAALSAAAGALLAKK